MSIPSDQAIRNQAIDLKHSFIVQAPAGSGKTELLIQRFLAALSDCHFLPEEVLAITFTRKAAGEMKQRVIDALLIAKSAIPPQNAHAKKTYDLARSVLAKDSRLNWQILEKQHRICIMTIDALCRAINKQSIQSLPNPHPAPKTLYQTAVTDFINDLAQENNQDLKEVLLFFDHQPNWLQQLFCESLASRDQWLPLLFKNHDSEAAANKYIDNIWQPILEDFSVIDPSCLDLLLECHDRCYSNTITDQKVKLKNFAKILLTSTGEIRKSLTIRQGVLSVSTTNCPQTKAKRKQDKIKLLAYAKANYDFFYKVQLAPLIDNPKLLAIIPKILRLLQKLVAYLKFHMKEQNSSDFIEQSQQTIALLQSPIEWPNLDGIPRPGTIRHILIDEFQDTAKQQLDLLNSVLSHSDGNVSNSIFIVGDPMQSIYRFRQAEVALFYQVQLYGIENFKLTTLNLSCNFRSYSSLINAFNNLFPNIFPNSSCTKYGSVPYTKVYATNNKESRVKFISYQDEPSQFNAILEICKNNPGKHIGILVRSRLIAQSLLPYIRELEVIEHGLQSLANDSEVYDLWVITNFLLQPYDNLVIANLLRSRLIGISLQELYDLLENSSCLLEGMSQSNSIRYQNIGNILKQAIEFHLGSTLSERTLNLWQQLSPYANLLADQNLSSREYFSLLQIAEQTDPFNIKPVLLELLQGPVPSIDSGLIEIMTIHHAKGLEFDIVILPCLERTTAARNGKILWWDAISDGFLWLPNHPNQNNISSAHKYIYDIERKKESQEQIRLLYVAMTRAKQDLYCLATIKDDRITSNSFLSLLYNWVEFFPGVESSELKQESNKIEFLETNPNYTAIDPVLDYDLLSESEELIIGIAYHYWIHLYLLGDDCNLARQTKLSLLEQGVNQSSLDLALDVVEKSWQKAQHNSFWSWLLSSDEIYSEYSTYYNGCAYIIDAYVVRGEICWIIDFKTKINPCSNTLESWFKQTLEYKKVLSAQKPYSEIRLLVYNPIIDKIWLEMENKYVASNLGII